ncbi:hypothetical protein B566_EDAN017783 [Ephemera danica]|nr:hypothetical protein B566_EDAN017783 [Ephemera danica]
MLGIVAVVFLQDCTATTNATSIATGKSTTTPTTPETTMDQETLPDYLDLTSPLQNFSESVTLVISMFVVILILVLICLILVGYICHLRRKMPRSARETATDDILFEYPTFDTVKGRQEQYIRHN